MSNGGTPPGSFPIATPPLDFPLRHPNFSLISISVNDPNQDAAFF